MAPFDILEAGFNKEIAEGIVNSYGEIERNYVLRKWKPSELDAGHFVEAVRRALDLELSGSYLPFTQPLPRFDDNSLKHYEQKVGDESYRILIPRLLKAIYNIRNKRGVAHISNVNPNEMDATLILYAVKWVLAELIRLKSGLSLEETQALLDGIVERQSPLIWKEGSITWVLSPGMKTRDQILVLLYDRSPRTEKELREITEYANPTNFRSILRKLHKEKLVHFGKPGDCNLSPSGINAAEEIIQGVK